ncbi:GH25 family lysozyme [Actinophytocola algeriensis]|uniref:GH25 family lysozyme M1 (1,4-beta-N-acetylmuramidase) n=1 Tax=Actinophytocola algeriensis TaxID=1768010 RepID=A0A7W7VDD0_9PSEU|nr:GH25 family lysozyme [Actinophytocola algeriensis]MBB4905850.1 GH25 family lysozyme M1 (1,4-beta-N-acetylmuramidase) [Actinophytocola algeriensis]MBE1472465.1 GH25 family lysozyme M1 (1,4-beta-N-acetylmuramidase) [Actinophytocola algeriensis]
MLAHALVAAVIAVAAPVPPGMVTGVDVATWQAGIDFTQARADGHGFAIVKAGGSQLTEGPYTSPHYATQVAGARAAGLRVGHYWVTGDFSTPVRAADFFADHLHDYRRGDVLALDNEVLDDSTRLWNDSEVAAFFTRVHDRVGDHVPWLYMGAADLRSGSWPRTIATGTKLWVASWGANDGSYPGDPDLGGAYPSWSAHQYTSNGVVGGMRVDLNVARQDAFDVVTPGDPPETPPLPKTTTEQDGVPGAVFWQRTQNWLSMDWGYTGPIDGVPGVNTYSALQRAMRGYGYTGPVDGVPGVNTWAAVQRLGAQWGYTGPVDGVMGPNSWRAFARFVNQDVYD